MCVSEYVLVSVCERQCERQCERMYSKGAGLKTVRGSQEAVTREATSFRFTVTGRGWVALEYNDGADVDAGETRDAPDARREGKVNSTGGGRGMTATKMRAAQKRARTTHTWARHVCAGTRRRRDIARMYVCMYACLYGG